MATQETHAQIQFLSSARALLAPSSGNRPGARVRAAQRSSGTHPRKVATRGVAPAQSFEIEKLETGPVDRPVDVSGRFGELAAYKNGKLKSPFGKKKARELAWSTQQLLHHELVWSPGHRPRCRGSLGPTSHARGWAVLEVRDSVPSRTAMVTGMITKQ